MEIRKYLDIMGTLNVEDDALWDGVPEGRMVLLVANSEAGVNFGSASPTYGASGGGNTDLPGVRLPNDDAESNKSFYCVTWPVSNATLHGPIRLIIPTPSYDFALRRGFDQAENVPFTGEVHLTYPGHRHGVTIPLGNQALAFARGVFRVLSGQFIYSAAVEVPGQALVVANTATDTALTAGMLLEDPSDGRAVVAFVERFDPDDASLTFRTIEP